LVDLASVVGRATPYLTYFGRAFRGEAFIPWE